MSETSTATRILLGYGVILIALHVWGALEPSHVNWGVHIYGLYVSPAPLLMLLLAGAALLLPVQRFLLNRLTTAADVGANLPPLLLVILLSALLIGASTLFPATLHLLGDGAILLRSIPHMTWHEIPESYRNQPLMALMYQAAFHTTKFVTAEPPSPQAVFILLDIAGGILFIALLVYALRYLKVAPVEKFLFGLLLAGGGGSQFFFGYVENYILQYVVTMAYALFGWLALEKKVHPLIPIACFVLMVGLHIGSLVFLPSLGFFLIQQLKKKKLAAALLAGAVGLGVVALFVVMKFDLVTSLKDLLERNRDFLPLFGVGKGYFPYAMFSFRHAIDWLNLQLFIVPFGLILPLVVMFVWRRALPWTRPEFLFLLGAAACGMLFTFIVNSALGLARDWDLMAGFFTPLMVFGVFLLALPLKWESRRPVLVALIVLTFIQLGGMIGVNAHPGRHLQRAEILSDTRFLSSSARLFYYEAMSNYLYGQKNYPKAQAYYEQYMAIDSSNTRILANLSDVYRKSNQKDAYFRILLRTAALASPNPGVYSNLGVEYAMRGDTANAIAMNQKAVAMDSAQKQAHSNLGVLFMNARRFDEAAYHLTTALRLGMKDPALFRAAGDVLALSGDYPRSLLYYDQYLALAPKDERIREVRNRVANLAAKNAAN